MKSAINIMTVLILNWKWLFL